MTPETDDKEARLLTEATARVTWGDFPDEVEAYLVREGMEATQAVTLVQALVRERSKEVRQRGWVKLGAGLGMVLVAVIYFAWFFNSSRDRRSRWDRLWGASFLALGITGLASTWRGICGLCWPSTEELTDVTEDENLLDG